MELIYSTYKMLICIGSDYSTMGIILIIILFIFIVNKITGTEENSNESQQRKNTSNLSKYKARNKTQKHVSASANNHIKNKNPTKNRINKKQISKALFFDTETTDLKLGQICQLSYFIISENNKTAKNR